MLVDGFPVRGLGVSVANDGTLYQNEVCATSHAPRPPEPLAAAVRGLALVVRLVRVQPLALVAYLEQLAHLGQDSGAGVGRAPSAADWDKLEMDEGDDQGLLYTFPQTVCIAGGHPSSSYSFIGVQGDGLLYLDPLTRTPPHATHDGHRSLSPDVLCAGSVSPDAYSRGGSLNPAFARGESMSPDLRAARVWDPSMLIGFVVRDEVEWVDLRRRIGEVHVCIYGLLRPCPSLPPPSPSPCFPICFSLLSHSAVAIQHEPPTWPGADDDDMGLESISPRSPSDFFTILDVPSSTPSPI
ncbi:hypothetical protein C8R44DRAFT_886254 [Mycena epipterygia]|nr:hypothetical protein C8R44DRAFT_886254 [Mycena epipterygia]